MFVFEFESLFVPQNLPVGLSRAAVNISPFEGAQLAEENIFFKAVSCKNRKRSLVCAFQEIEFIFYLTGINNKQLFFFFL